MTSEDSVFQNITEFPDSDYRRRFEDLVGLDHVKDILNKEARILLNRSHLESWSKEHYGSSIQLIKRFHGRAPLFIFAGDVGTGKTEIAESFGDAVARAEGIPIMLYEMSLGARGSGAVGEMTTLLGSAFSEVRAAAASGANGTRKPSSAVILFIDEADAVAQSRNLSQMHHEDRAGVNALIRGIDSLGKSNLPALVVMCTNRLDAVDPAVRRRAAGVFEFFRPDRDQRHAVLARELSGVDFSDEQVSELAEVTGPNGTRDYGFTYSDLTQRLLPSILLSAFPDKAVNYSEARNIALSTLPTPPFGRGDL